MLRPKKNSYKEFDKEKKIPAARKFPSPPPHNFSNGPSLRRKIYLFMNIHLITIALRCFRKFTEGK